jgi:outer membrane lipoprotein-sorting protein
MFSSLRNVLSLLGVAALAVSLAEPSPAVAAGPDTLQDILARMDQAAASFKGMTAQMKRLDHTAVINDTSEERGAVALRKTPKGVQIQMQSTYPDQRTLVFQGRNLQIYLPKINTIQIYDLGRKRDQIDQFLVLGFGVSGKELQKQYTMKLLPSETLNGVKTSRIDLTPKSSSAQELFQHLELWIPEGGSHSVQQKVHLRGGDYKLLTYSDIKLNPATLGDANFNLGAPPNAKKEYIGK